MIKREPFLRQAQSPEDKLVIARVLDKAEEVLSEHQPRATNFLDPYQQALAQKIVQGLGQLCSFFAGGYSQAERQRLIFYPDYLAPEDVEIPLKYLQITGNFKYRQVTHRDYLGSILGLGLNRDKLGDIILLPEGNAQVIADPAVASYILRHLNQVHQVAVKVREISQDELCLPEEKVKELHTTVASLRLDAVAGEGFGVSRSQMTREITAEKVKLNWFTTTNCAQKVSPGDVISIRGRGRLVVERISGTTKKGRIGLVLKRYL